MPQIAEQHLHVDFRRLEQHMQLRRRDPHDRALMHRPIVQRLGKLRAEQSLEHEQVDLAVELALHILGAVGRVDDVDAKGLVLGASVAEDLPSALRGDPYRLGQLLSNIVLPIPGLKGSIDAGFTFKYAEPCSDQPMINEYEQNPQGTDAGHEWVEIFNPTEEAVSLSGWTIETMHGVQRCDDMGDVLLLPHAHLVYTFSKQTLDNEGEGKFPVMESVVLRDSSGKRVDSTPWTVDNKNDGRTWQRSFDGSDRWEFRAATKTTEGLFQASARPLYQFLTFPK